MILILCVSTEKKKKEKNGVVFRVCHDNVVVCLAVLQQSCKLTRSPFLYILFPYFFSRVVRMSACLIHLDEQRRSYIVICMSRHITLHILCAHKETKVVVRCHSPLQNVSCVFRYKFFSTTKLYTLLLARTAY